jgi:hypothetical protein
VADLRTIRGVELVKVGTWDISSGQWTVTAEDLAAAVAAHQAGVLRKPVVKIGHEDPRFDGGPALGFIDNLRVTADGATLVGDLVGVPAAIAKLLPHAYPDRSVEALVDYEAPDGSTWPLVVTAVALLGAEAPGIDNLAAVQDLYGLAAKRRIALAAGHRTHDRARAVRVAAARRRRAHRTLQTKG